MGKAHLFLVSGRPLGYLATHQQSNLPGFRVKRRHFQDDFRPVKQMELVHLDAAIITGPMYAAGLSSGIRTLAPGQLPPLPVQL